MRTTAAMVALAFVSTLASAYDEQRARNSLADDYAQCAVYYMIAKTGLARRPALNDAEKETMAFLQQSIDLSKAASEALAGEQYTEGRMQVAVQAMRRKMDDKMEKFSIIATEYGYPCEDWLENPDARMRYWLEKR